MKLTVHIKPGTKIERRFRAGHEFGAKPREVDVKPAEAKAIEADPYLVVAGPDKKPAKGDGDKKED